MYQLPFMRTLQKATRPRVIFGNFKPDHGLGVMHGNKIGTTGFPIKKFDEGGLMNIGQEMEDFQPQDNFSAAFGPNGDQTLPLDLQRDSEQQFSDDMKKKRQFLGMGGKDWLGLGLGAIAGALGSTGQPSMAAPASLFNPAIGAINQSMGNSSSPVFGKAAGIIGGTSNAMHKAEGGPVNSQEDGQNQQIFQDAVAALTGQSKDPQSAIQNFVAHYGKEALMELQQRLSQMQGQGQPQGSPQPQAQPQPQQQPQQGYANGGILAGPGSGMSDSIPATHSGTGQRVQVSDGEYIVPADAVAMLGDGSSDSGAKKLDAGIARLRKVKYGHSKQPKPLKPNSNPILD